MNKQYNMDRDFKLHFFGEGEWMEEPDEVYFDYKGMQCRIKRNSLGALCGYVMIPKKHSLYNKDDEHLGIQVHGGITYQNFDDEGKYWIGFDCVHSGDLKPRFEIIEKNIKDEKDPELKQIYELTEKFKKMLPDSELWKITYKNISFVTKECKHMVDQILEMKQNEL